MSQKERERLLTEFGAFSAAGIERAAWGWDRYVADDLDSYRDAERAALHAIEKADRGSKWDEFRRSIFDMTEGGRALVAWQYEHGEIGHKAERAAFGAALALFARDRITGDQFATLARPMDEALPWLLPKEPPHPYPVGDREV
ncbi:MAG: hypothetical protein ACRDG6_12805 [Candidatus Limnocylindria bacterium]